MYITEVLTKTKSGEVSHRCVLLRETYRADGKVKNKTLANLTHCKQSEIDVIRFALKNKDTILDKGIADDKVQLRSGKSVGAVCLVYEIAKRLGIESVLGTDWKGKLAMWQIIARVIEQGSRLSAVRLANVHAACDVLGIRRGFDENDLYDNLHWLASRQGEIEQGLYLHRTKGKHGELFLYDVTSSYFDGEHNELADWGYNRDGKKGKKQVVIGLLCDDDGEPVSIEAFQGNTRDNKTFTKQVRKTAKKFGCKRVIFVGDRGMIKSQQIEKLGKKNFYITAITKPEIEKMIREKIIQVELFDENLCEVEDEDVRYILRKNPMRAEEMRKTRDEKKSAIQKLCKKKNYYLKKHEKAHVDAALNEISKRIEKLKIIDWLKAKTEGRRIIITEDKSVRNEEEKLDGCYVIKSNLDKDVKARIIHDRYKDLAMVERAFRTCKTGLLELRPWYVQTEESTRGHAFVVMLSLIVIKHLETAWRKFDLTVEEGLKHLSSLSSIEIIVKEKNAGCHKIPEPNEDQAKLLKAAQVALPKILPKLNTRVVSRKKLQEQRVTT